VAGVATRLRSLDWLAVEQSLDERGYARLPQLLAATDCRRTAAIWEHRDRFRSAVVMERMRFGRGEYRYFAHPLPPVVESLRAAAYAHLAPIANRWAERLASAERFPASLEAFLERCAGRGQRRPTPLLLRYGPGDYNCLHQDLYGGVVFPLQVAIGLDRPGRDYTGGELLLVEQRPRAQSRGSAIAIAQGEGIVFTTRARPAAGRHGFHRVVMRHGASEVLEGHRRVLGLIFHDAA
jgi:hypothetical protein